MRPVVSFTVPPARLRHGAARTSSDVWNPRRLQRRSPPVGYSPYEHRFRGGHILMDGNPFDRIRVRPSVMPSILGGHGQMVASFPYHFAQSLRIISIRITEGDEV